MGRRMGAERKRGRWPAVSAVLLLTGTVFCLKLWEAPGRHSPQPVTEASGVYGMAEEDPGPYIDNKEDQALLEAYQAYNADVVGLIRIKGTVLNHPLVQTPKDEGYYLNRDLNGEYNSHGVPLLSADSRMEGGGNTVIFGHNIHKRTKDVFADLAGYEELEFYKQHPVVETISESGTRRWLVFAYYLVDNAEPDAFRYSDAASFLSKQEFDAYMSQVKARNWLQVPVKVGVEDAFLTLSSCSLELAGSGTNRMVVMAVQLAADEDCQKIVDGAVMADAPLLPKRLRP